MPKKGHGTGMFLRKILNHQTLENHQNIIGKLIQKDKEYFSTARRQPWLAESLVFAASLKAFVSVCVLSPYTRIKCTYKLTVFALVPNFE